jgi:hypothetical protein
MLTVAACGMQATMVETFIRKTRQAAEADAQEMNAVPMSRVEPPPSAACFEDVQARCETLEEQHLRAYKKHAGLDIDDTEIAEIVTKANWCQEGVCFSGTCTRLSAPYAY